MQLKINQGSAASAAEIQNKKMKKNTALEKKVKVASCIGSRNSQRTEILKKSM
jgi:hypothetical protein